MDRSLQIAIASYILFPFISGSHFRGGTISWKCTGTPYQVEFKFRLAWTYGNGPGCTVSKIGKMVTRMGEMWMAHLISGGTPFNISTVNYICMAASVSEDWERGERTFVYDFLTPGPYIVSYTGGDWAELGYGTGGSWNISTTVDLHSRSDTHLPNFSPITQSRPLYRVQFGCHSSLRIPLFDADGDSRRCRWATKEEASSIAMVLPTAVLNEFLIRTVSLSSSCNAKPIFVSPTPSEGSLQVVKAHQTLHVKYSIFSRRRLQSVVIDGPTLLAQTSIALDVGRPDVYYVAASWTPKQSDQGSHLICAMAEDYIQKMSGTRCITVIAWDKDPCDNHPCRNMAACSRIGYTQEYVCHCLLGYSGKNCQTDIDECLSNPCENSGQCVNLINAYRCHCKQGYLGSNCQIDVNECLSNPCKHGSHCIDKRNEYRCTCKLGYTGRDCEIDINDCISDPCFNNGSCVDGIDSWTCQCLSGFTGTQCIKEIDECKSNPCLHNGTCIDLINEYKCLCINSTRGNNCENWIDHCKSSPCLNNGICGNIYGGFSCSCSANWNGHVCEYAEVNRTELCTDMVYSECSCYIKKLKPHKKKSSTIAFGAVGIATGIAFTVGCYIVWQNHKHCHGNKNRVAIKQRKPVFQLEQFDEHQESSFDERETKSDMSEELVPGPMHCKCFVDVHGFDHSSRIDPKNSRFRSHVCRHMKIQK